MAGTQDCETENMETRVYEVRKKVVGMNYGVKRNILIS